MNHVVLCVMCLLASRVDPVAIRASPLATCTPLTIEVASPAQVAAVVRLRKLHLVRPDLISYPLNYEVFC